MYTVCYVLTDNEKQKYFNEFMISVSSLRYQGFKGPVLLITDAKTSAILSDHKDEISDCKVDLITAETPENYSEMESSRFLKTCLRELVKGDYLFVDTDTIFAQDLPEIISEDDIALVPDRHILTFTKGTIPYRYCKPIYKKVGVDDIEGKTYFNTGVMWVRDNRKTHEFYRQWHVTWLDYLKKGVPYDQQAFNYTDWQAGHFVSQLDASYNVQVSSNAVIPFDLISRSYILHYYNLRWDTEYLLSKKEIREKSYKSEIIQNIIRSPRSAFANGRVVNESEGIILDTACYRAVRRLYRKHKGFFNLIEKTLKLISKITRRK